MSEVLVTPDAKTARFRTLTHATVARVLSRWLHPGGLGVSPLGPAWSRDVDAYLVDSPDPEVLGREGWLLLDHLLAAVGSPQKGRWAVVVDDEIVGAADLERALPPDPVAAVLTRARRRGRVGPREVAEMDALRAQGYDVPDELSIPSLRAWRSWAGSARASLRPRVVVAITGVDGAGKSSLASRLLKDLLRAGVPVSRVWARPGMTTPAVSVLARLGKRVVGQDPRPGVRQAASGSEDRLVSRRGLVGRVWVSVLVATFCLEVRRQYARSTGVVMFDRHVDDAKVTLRVLYRGQSHPVAEWFIARALPRAAIRVHLDVPMAVAVARKPGDPIGEWAVARQLTEYAALGVDSDLLLDGRRTPQDLSSTVLRALVQRMAPQE